MATVEQLAVLFLSHTESWSLLAQLRRRLHVLVNVGVLPLLIAFCIGFFGSAHQLLAASSDSEADHFWQIILEEANGPGNRFTSQAEAVKAIKAHLDKQEVSLRNFVRLFPDDPHKYSASIRLSGVLTAKSRLLKQPALRSESHKILADLEEAPGVPAPIKADAGFARVSQAMEDAAGQTDDATRDGLLSAIRSFDAHFPNDRRTPGLLTEIATLYDAQPARKKSLLDEAASRTTDESLRQRIDDDRKRLARLGNPLDLRLNAWQGEKSLQLASLHGRVVILFFWASWSLPALRELGQLQQDAVRFSGQPVDFLTVSLDTDKKVLASACQAANLRWLVHCDGRGWQGEMVRSLGINSLPTVWILDRHGNLLTLNAHGAESAEIIEKALASK